jgi:hypothetical protein
MAWTEATSVTERAHPVKMGVWHKHFVSFPYASRTLAQDQSQSLGTRQINTVYRREEGYFCS